MTDDLELTKEDKYQYWSSWLIAIGFISQLAPKGFGSLGNQLLIDLGPYITIAGMLMVLVSCILLAKSKNRTAWLGVLGIFNLLGYIVIAIIPTKETDA